MQLDLDEYTIFASEELLKQVWINLIDNAIKFSNEGGAISITALEKKDCISISITNYGFEIPKEAMPKLFNKFYQADASHSTEGNGIGLAIAKKIIDLHNGTIKAKSENLAVTFTVTIPKNIY